MGADAVKKSKQLHQLIAAADKIAIIGHKRPDGDCIGSTLGMYNYIIDNYKGKTVQVYTEAFPAAFRFLSGSRKIKHEPMDERYDLAISLDVSSMDRLGDFQDIFNSAISTVCIDHHVSNPGFGDLCYIVGGASSTCEVMCDLIDRDKITEKTGNVIGVTTITPDEDIMMITSKGTIIRTAVDGISVMGRTTQGVMLMRLDKEEKVVSIAKADHEEESDEADAENTEVIETTEETSSRYIRVTESPVSATVLGVFPIILYVFPLYSNSFTKP